MRRRFLAGAGGERPDAVERGSENVLRAAATWEPVAGCPDGLLTNALAQVHLRRRACVGRRLAAVAAIVVPVGAGIAIAVRTPRANVTVRATRGAALVGAAAQRKAPVLPDVSAPVQAVADARSLPKAGPIPRPGNGDRSKPSARRTSAARHTRPTGWKHYTVRTYVAGVTTPYLMAATDHAGTPVLVPVALDRPLQVGAVHANLAADGSVEVAPVRYATEEYGEGD